MGCLFLEPEQSVTEGDMVQISLTGLQEITVYRRQPSSYDYVREDSKMLPQYSNNSSTYTGDHNGPYAWIWIVGIMIALIIITILLLRT